MPRENQRFGPLNYFRLWAGLGVLMILVVIVGSLVAMQHPMSGVGSDKTHHLVAYGAMTWWWGMVQPERRFHWALGLLLLGGALEGAQSLTPWRSMEVADMMANAAGVLIALVVLLSPAAQLLRWVDRQLSNRFNAGPS